MLTPPRRASILAALEDRREAGDMPCDDCEATGLVDRVLCSTCLGQKVLLSGEEYAWLMEVAMRSEDEILGASIIE